MAKRHSVGSIAEYLTLVTEIRDEWTEEDEVYFDPWFRGHRDSKWALQPNIFRHELQEYETELRMAFRRMGVQLLAEREPADEWSWYFLMQHYRAPTRLLDWSDGALIGLFFALAPQSPGSDEDDAPDAAVWMLDPWWLNYE